MNKRRGRPTGRPQTRERIIDAARPLFLERGYSGTTIRAIASAADVDSALISYHFGSKHGLFAESMLLQLSPAAALERALHGDPTGLVDRILHSVTALWEDPELSAPLSTLIYASMADDQVERLFSEYLNRELVGRIAEFLGPPDAHDRAAAAVTVIAGLIFTRYLLPLSPTAQLTASEVRRVIGPPLRAALYASRRPNSRPARP